jgi:hypothetical protein
MTWAVDLTDLDMWARGVPYAEFARLRREAPIAWHDEDAPEPVRQAARAAADAVT